MKMETAIEKALYWINQACMKDESINQNEDLGRAVQSLQSVLPRFQKEVPS